jgi:adenine-specific DNA-methyltransferase
MALNSLQIKSDFSKDTRAYDKDSPHIIKYMGSKKKILDFIINAIFDAYIEKGSLCDLFSGANTIASALRHKLPIHSNDIQSYSYILGKTFLSDYNWKKYPNIINDVIEKAFSKVQELKKEYPELKFHYYDNISLSEFNNLEKKQKDLINNNFKNDYHLFTKYYSGTYWTYDQCIWIDSIKSVADEYLNSPVYFAILSSLMFAMAYNSQSTGHYAQYRDANNKKSMDDILIYRKKEILPFFKRKLEELIMALGRNDLNHKVTTLDYMDCLDCIESNSTIYADPPYCFVHYSRFYHALETLVKYDYPNVQFKGRYRINRHQSPFCIRTQVKDAFIKMFNIISKKESNMVLSYSNTGMIDFEDLFAIAKLQFGKKYLLEYRNLDYFHSTMGRREDKERSVQESVIIAKKY